MIMITIIIVMIITGQHTIDIIIDVATGIVTQDIDVGIIILHDIRGNYKNGIRRFRAFLYQLYI